MPHIKLLGLFATMALTAACAGPIPEPSLRTTTGSPRASVTEVTPGPTVAPSGGPSPAPVANTPITMTRLSAMLTAAGFTCSSTDVDHLNCLGNDAQSGNSFSVSAKSSMDSIGAFTLLANLPKTTSPASNAAASEYLGFIYDQITGDSDGPARLITAFAAEGSFWTVGKYIFVSIAAGSSTLGITAHQAADIAAQIIIAGTGERAVLTRAGYTCSSVTDDPTGYSRFGCSLASGAKAVIMFGEDNLIHVATLSGGNDAIKLLLATMFSQSDTAVLAAWLDGAGKSASKTFGSYTLNLTTAVTTTLLITTDQ